MKYHMLPAHMQNVMRRYIEDGIEPGGFLTAVICNDLVGAFGMADDINLANMKVWASFLYNEAPSGCWGSRRKMDGWIISRRETQG